MGMAWDSTDTSPELSMLITAHPAEARGGQGGYESPVAF